jgi:hypothetical protein
MPIPPWLETPGRRTPHADGQRGQKRVGGWLRENKPEAGAAEERTPEGNPRRANAGSSRTSRTPAGGQGLEAVVDRRMERRSADHRKAGTGRPAPIRIGGKALKGSPSGAAGREIFRTGRLDAAFGIPSNVDDGQRGTDSGGSRGRRPQSPLGTNPKRASADGRDPRGGRGCRLARRTAGPGPSRRGERLGVARRERGSSDRASRIDHSMTGPSIGRAGRDPGTPCSPNLPEPGPTSDEEFAGSGLPQKPKADLNALKGVGSPRSTPYLRRSMGVCNAETGKKTETRGERAKDGE